MAGDGAHERPGLALGTQCGVDRPDRALTGVVGADPDHVAGQLGGRLESGVLVIRVSLGRRPGEDHVDVGDVVELVSPALAHRDHREAGQAGGLTDALPGDGEGGFEGAGR